jgi:hypothetical protein
MSRVCCSTPDALAAKPQLLHRLDTDADLIGGLADRIGCTDRAVD